ncbi:MAG: hypothetical protein ACJ73E_05070 [Mycobacteriales bacterium]
MTDRTELEQALSRVCEAAREHLRVVLAADGEDDDAVWARYVALNNAALAYDRLLEDRTGEVTPWEIADELSVEDDDAGAAGPAGEADEAGDDLRISVRQRRDYVVPSIDGLLAAGAAARQVAWGAVDQERGGEPVRSVGEAVYELLHAGGGSLAGLDVPALVPQSGLVLVNVVDDTLGPDDLDAPPHEADELFALPDSPLVFSLYEPVYGSVEEAERDLEGRPRGDG